jgi:hypothetical protein
LNGHKPNAEQMNQAKPEVPHPTPVQCPADPDQNQSDDNERYESSVKGEQQVGKSLIQGRGCMTPVSHQAMAWPCVSSLS